MSPRRRPPPKSSMTMPVARVTDDRAVNNGRANGSSSHSQPSQSSAPSSISSGSSSALNQRGGSPHSNTATALEKLTAMDLQTSKPLQAHHHDILINNNIDLGYSELVRSNDEDDDDGGDRSSSDGRSSRNIKHTSDSSGSETIRHARRHNDDEAQRTYLSGPIDELVESLPRPSPLSRAIPLSSLPSPAISTTSTSSAVGTPQFEMPPGGIHHHYAPLLDSTPSRPRPRAFTLSHSAFGSFGTFPSTARAGPVPAPTIISRVRLFFLQLFANAASAAFLALIVVWALSARGLNASLRWLRGFKDIRERRPWDTDELRLKYANERVVKDIQYYAQQCGFDVIEQTIETKDGYLLKMFKVECLKKPGKVHCDGRRGFPVLIQHGLFQSCGSFITSEERSLAFWLAEQGDYQVYLGNNRGVFDMGHTRLKRSDPRFWDYNIKELALYDLPAMVDHVRRETGYDKVAFIGHSQGNATMFCSLAHGMVPELGEKLSIFIALAPAVYAGPLTTGFPFGALKSMKWKTWRRWFGVLDFIPLMRISYNYVPSRPFGLLGYQMFAFLFNWTDANWLLRRKAKTFRFTPSPVSSASIFWWTGYGGFSTRGCVLDPAVPKWFDHRFPPLAIHHGGRDYLVLTEPLLERLEKHEKDVRVITVKKMEEGEHCDFFWHVDAVELCFESMLSDIEKTRPRYPDEDGLEHDHPSHYSHAYAASSHEPSHSASTGQLEMNGSASARERASAKANGRAHAMGMNGDSPASGRRVTRASAAAAAAAAASGGHHVAFADSAGAN